MYDKKSTSTSQDEFTYRYRSNRNACTYPPKDIHTTIHSNSNNKTVTTKLSHTHQRMKRNIIKLHVKIQMKLTNVISQNYAMYIKPKEVAIK